MTRKVRKASHWEKESLEYSFPGYLPRKMLTMIAGKRGDAKSLLATWIAGQVSTGRYIQPDGAQANGATPGLVWYNTMEDSPGNIVKPRLQAVGADLERVYLTEWPLEIPDDAAIVRDTARRGKFDLIILDSMQQHFRNVYHGFRNNRRGMDLMFRIAKESNCSILFVHHFNKGKHPSVGAAIGGQGIIQNMTKAIYVMGQHPDTFGSSQRYWANDRINAEKPSSLAFDIRTKKLRGFTETVPYLEYLGQTQTTAMDVLKAAHIEQEGTSRLTNAEQAAEWLRDYLEDGNPRRVREVEDAAQADKRYFSQGTFHRAREQAGVEKMGKRELKEVMGEDFDWLSSEDTPPKTHWVRLAPVDDIEDLLETP